MRPRPPRDADGSPLAAPRTATHEELQRLSRMIERHDEAFEWIAPLWREIPAAISEIKADVGALTVSTQTAADAIRSIADDVRDKLRQHGDSIEALTERTQDHQAKWLLLDAEKLPPRVKALEEQRDQEDTTARISTALVAQQRGYIAFAMRHAWKMATALAAAAAAYFGLGG